MLMWLLVYNEEKLYDPRKQSHKHFAMQKDDYVDKEMVPRLFKTNIGDIYTTNCLEANTSDSAQTTGVSVAVGNTLKVGSTGYLEVFSSGTPAGPIFKVVAYTTMPDGQDAVKLQRIS